MSGRALRAALLAALLGACGVTAGNPGSGGKTHERFSLYGSVQTLERAAYTPMRVGVYDGYGQEVTYAMSASNSTYVIDGLEPGAYWVQIGEGFREPVNVEEDTLLNVVLPIPAAPTHLRHIELGPNDFCLLWLDNSGVETGYRVAGPHATWEAPANAVGVRVYRPAAGQWQTAEEALAMVAHWNASFGGSYVLTAWNTYGPSATAYVEVPALDTAGLDPLRPPPEPPVGGGNPEKELCLSVARNQEQPQFIGP